MINHRHRWSVIDFLVEADRPMMRQTCGCGAVRVIPAWDRAWAPEDPGGNGDPRRDVSWRPGSTSHNYHLRKFQGLSTE
jgi:hypothetical protein